MVVTNKITVIFKSIVLFSLLLAPAHFSTLAPKMISNYAMLITKQVGPFACWVATEEGILKYNGRTESQENIIKSFWLKRYGVFLDGLQTSFLINSHLLSLPPEYITSVFEIEKYINKTDIEIEIDNNHPVVSMNNNHMSIIVGYDKEYYYVADPWYGRVVIIEKSYFEFFDRTVRELGGARFFVPKEEDILSQKLEGLPNMAVQPLAFKF
jgi:hypothetical protein